MWTWIYLTGALLAGVYVCTDKDGHSTFTDLGCPGHIRYHGQTPVNSSSLSLSDDEQEQLEQLHRQQQTQLEHQKRQAAVRLKARQANKANQQRLCRVASDALKSLAKQRRKGYSLAEQARLKEKLTKHQKDKRKNC